MEDTVVDASNAHNPRIPHTAGGFTLWFTGLPGSGKTTLARRMSWEVAHRGLRVEVLDGDVVRENLSKGLGYSKEDRDTNVQRIGFVCNLLSRNGVVAIVAAISPYRATREEIRASQDKGRFVEVFLDCPLEVLVARDVKGLYRKALRGEIGHFTGISDPYEPPESPEIALRTDRETVEESARRIVAWLEQMGYVPDGSTGSPASGVPGARGGTVDGLG